MDKGEELANAFAAELGIDQGDEPTSDPLEGLYDDGDEASPEEASAEAAEAAEAAEEEPSAEFVHEPTGRKFENEADLLRYENGWLNDKYGHQMKELREELQGLREQREQPKEGAPQNMDDLKKKLWPDSRWDDIRGEAVSDFMLQGMDNALTMVTQPLLQEVQSLKQELGGLKSEAAEERTLGQAGLDRATAQGLVEKHEWLGQIADPGARVAAMKALVSQQRTAEQASPKLADRIPQRSAADHVEGSVGNSMPDAASSFEDKLLKMDDKEKLSAFGELFTRNAEVSERIRGNFDS